MAILFLKARIAGGAAADLFAAPVMVAGHVRADTGKYVAPYASSRQKRLPEAAPAKRAGQPDLFSAPPRPAPPPQAKPAAPPAPGLFTAPPPIPVAGGKATIQRKPDAARDGRIAQRRAVREALEAGKAPADIIAQTGASAELVAALQREMAPPPPAAEAAPTPPEPEPVTPPPSPPDLSAEVVPPPAQAAPEPYVPPTPPARGRPRRPGQWGHHEGVSQKARVAANRRAEDVLRTKRDEEMTQADIDTLGQYTGWGGCGTSANEYYTPRPIARAMWSVLETLGFRGGAVLEPSAGTGAFQQEAPERATITAIELSDDAARINRILHGPAGDEVVATSLEDWVGNDQRKFAAVIGNPPFGARGAFRERDLAMGKPAIHRAEWYFLDTALDKTEDGGLVAVIVPNGVMDNPSGRDMRARMLAKAQLITAFRLPSSAFADSHTTVTTDILFLRKRPQAIAGAINALSPMQQALLPHWREEVVAGRYMLEGEGNKHVLGKIEAHWRVKLGQENAITVTGSMEGLDREIADWQPPEGALADDSPTLEAVLDAAGDRRDEVERASRREPYRRIPEGTTRVMDGILYVLRGSRWHRAEEPEPEEVAAARKVGALLEPVLSGSAGNMETARQRLTEALDEFTAKYGQPGRSRVLLDWTSAPRLPAGRTDAAEHHEMVTREAKRVAMLLGAVRADGSYSDAVMGRAAGGERADLSTIATSLAERDGEFTPEALARAGGAADDEARAMLDAHTGFARIPGTDRWTSLDHYTTGDLWPTYDAALAAAQSADNDPIERARFQRQADAVLAAIAPIDLADVPNIRLDSPFIPLEAIAAWKQSQGNWRWKATERDGVFSVTSEQYGRTISDDLLERMLMRRGVRQDEADLVEQRHAEFRDWLLSDPTWKPQAEERYNRTLRGYQPRAYSDAPIEVPGLSPDFSVHGFQWKGVRWALERGKGIIAADVGVGKTPRALILNQLLRSTGRAKKPVIVMPKSLLANWYDMAATMFPGAKVLTIGETITTDADGNRKAKEDDEAARRRKIADLAQNDYDFVLMTMPAWNLLNIEEDRRERYEQDEFFTKRRDALEGKSDKKKRAAKEAQQAKDERQRFRNKGEQILTLEQTGIDAVFLDEGHSLKNLTVPDSGPFKSVKFLGAPSSPSKQATASQHKFRYIREQTGGQNIFLLTATPTKNSPLELYSMMQHVAPEAWEQAGIRNADDFIARFVETGPELILGIGGQIEEQSVVKGFTSLDEVRGIARRYIDRTTAAEVGLSLPEAQVVEHKVEADEFQRAAYDELVPRLEQALADKGKEGIHPFTVMSDMQKAATDMRIYQPGGDHPPSPKLRHVAKMAAENRKDGGQLIFSDYVGAHGMIRDLLIAQGVDPKRIAIINAEAAPTSSKRQAIGDGFNRGDYDVLIGNTATMGEGLNLQKRTTDIHHVDTPWEPASIIQRNGRGLRQGNVKGNIRLHTYLTGGTFDGARWQSMMAKKDWQTAFWGGANEAENLAKDGRGSLSRLDMLVFASRDPEAAKEKFAAEFAAAKDRMADAKRAEANALWGRYREAAAQLRTMKAKRTGAYTKTEPTEAEDRLTQRVAAFKARLEAHPDFPQKDALDAPEVLIDTRNGRVWRPGDEVALSPGHRLSAYAGGEAEWLVRAVDEGSRKVFLVPAGRIREGKDMPSGIAVAIGDLRDGVSPTKIDRAAAKARTDARDAELAAAAEAARKRQEQAKEAASAALHRRVVSDFMEGKATIGDARVLHSMGEDWMREHAPAIRSRMKEGAASHAFRPDRLVTRTPDGRIMVRPSYSTKEIGADEEFALPDQDTLDRLIAGATKAHRNVRLSRYYAPTRSRSRHSPATGERGGVLQRFGGISEDAPPAMAAIRALYPQSVAREAALEVQRRQDAEVADHVREAPSFLAALSRAAGGFSAPPTAYGSGQPYNGFRAHQLGRETARALLEAAEKHGAAGQTWNTLLPAYSALKAELNDDVTNVLEMHSLIGENANPITRGRENVATVLRDALKHAFRDDAGDKAA
jgi:predicted RNA methylase